MKFHTFNANPAYPYAIAIKEDAFNSDVLREQYIKPTEKDENDFILVGLPYNEKGKAPVKFMRSYLEDLLDKLDNTVTKVIYCADANYFSCLTGKKATKSIGYAVPCIVKGYEHLTIIAGVNYKSVIYNPANETLLNISKDSFKKFLHNETGKYANSVLKNTYYPKEFDDIKRTLNQLHDYPELEIDIEGFSLKHHLAGIGTIAFAINNTDGLAFPVDYVPIENDKYYGKQIDNLAVKLLLREFFDTYKGKIVFHNLAYDVKVLIYELYMAHPLDNEGMYKGMDKMFRDIDDTKIISYLALNSTVKPQLGLKTLAYEYTGDYAKDDINDIRLIPLDKLLKYNLTDCVATKFVYDKYYPVMIKDNQETIYRSLMLPTQEKLTQIELTGAPVSPKRVAEVKKILTDTCEDLLVKLRANKIISDTEITLTDIKWNKDYEDRRSKAVHPENIKRKPRDEFPTVKFNFNSNKQLSELIYTQLGMPIIDLTDTKQPAVGADTLQKLADVYAESDEVKEILTQIIDYGKAQKILSTFIPPLEAAINKGDGVVYLHGSLNLNGTVSGRLSSSDPNLQNLPANSTYGKLIKSCFMAPVGWLFVGADFNSLEDYISALTTKDPNKLKVYIEGYDGHCLRAYTYFSDEMSGINPDSAESINSIKKLFPKFRQDSKAPTFALTYQGTWITLVKNCGFSTIKAKFIDKSFKKLYKVSIDWVNAKLNQACKDGYVTVAFGLRIRTPVLAKTILGHNDNLYMSEAEGRTAGNALGQSYGLLNNRAFTAFMEKVKNSKYRNDIKPCLLIHDSMYFMIKDDIEVIEWVNNNLIDEMSWQELPEIQHDVVKIGAELDIYYPTWADPITLKNYISQEEIVNTINVEIEKRNETRN